MVTWLTKLASLLLLVGEELAATSAGPDTLSDNSRRNRELDAARINLHRVLVLM